MKKKDNKQWLLNRYTRMYAIRELKKIGITKHLDKTLHETKTRGENGLYNLYLLKFNKNIDEAYSEYLHKKNNPTQKEQGYIYIVGNLEQMICKIGFSFDVDKRIKGIQTGCPFGIIILAKFIGTMDTEKQLHKKYKKHRIRKNGEWFHLRDELLESVKMHCEILANC